MNPKALKAISMLIAAAVGGVVQEVIERSLNTKFGLRASILDEEESENTNTEEETPD